MDIEKELTEEQTSPAGEEEKTQTESSAEDAGAQAEAETGAKAEEAEAETGAEAEKAAEPAPEERIAQLEKELADEKERYLRLDAEYYNFRQRSVKEKSQAYESAAEDAAKAILSVIDNFERAAQAECSDEGFKKGIEMIFKQYLDVLDKLGIKEIEALGAPFDPNFHNAVSSTEDENLGENVVAAVLQKGYTAASGKVIRPAMVTVANP